MISRFTLDWTGTSGKAVPGGSTILHSWYAQLNCDEITNTDSKRVIQIYIGINIPGSVLFLSSRILCTNTAGLISINIQAKLLCRSISANIHLSTMRHGFTCCHAHHTYKSIGTVWTLTGFGWRVVLFFSPP